MHACISVCVDEHDLQGNLSSSRECRGVCRGVGGGNSLLQPPCPPPYLPSPWEVRESPSVPGCSGALGLFMENVMKEGALLWGLGPSCPLFPSWSCVFFQEGTLLILASPLLDSTGAGEGGSRGHGAPSVFSRVSPGLPSRGPWCRGNVIGLRKRGGGGVPGEAWPGFPSGKPGSILHSGNLEVHQAEGSGSRKAENEGCRQWWEAAKGLREGSVCAHTCICTQGCACRGVHVLHVHGRGSRCREPQPEAA